MFAHLSVIIEIYHTEEPMKHIYRPIINLKALLTKILAVAVAVGKMAAAGTRGVRRGRRDEEAQNWVLLDHSLDRVILGLKDDFQTVLLIGRVAFQQPLRESVGIGGDDLHTFVVVLEGLDVLLLAGYACEYGLGGVALAEHLGVHPDVVLLSDQAISGISQIAKHLDQPPAFL